MLKFIVFFISLFKKGKKAEKKSQSIEDMLTEKDFDTLHKERETYKKEAPVPTKGQRVKNTFRNIKNVAANAFDNTVGYGIAKYQNYSTKRHFKKDPGSSDKIVYLMHGVLQNEGSQWRLARQLKKEGYKVRHLKGNHGLTRKQSSDKAFEQIDKFHKDTKLKDAHKRKDIYTGHSSGGDVGIYMAADDRIKKYGIDHVLARAPAPYGIKASTIGQKLLVPIAAGDDLKKQLGKRNAVEMAKRTPQITVDVVAGKYDDLVPPYDAATDKARKHYIIDHPDSTHFGTSGVNEEMNDVFIKLIQEGTEAKLPKYRYKRSPIKEAREEYQKAA